MSKSISKLQSKYHHYLRLDLKYINNPKEQKKFRKYKNLTYIALEKYCKRYWKNAEKEYAKEHGE